jgi:O-antigen/teichoic acid export membrane protein
VTLAERPSRIARNTVFNALTAGIGASAGFATSIIIARGLGPADTGVYTLIIWTAIATTTFVSNGLAFSIMKFVAQYDVRTRRETVVSVIGFGLRAQVALALAGGLALAAASGLLAGAFGIPEAQALFALTALIVVFNALGETMTAPILGLERQGLLVPIYAVHGLAMLAGAVVVMDVLDAGIKALIAVQIVVWFGSLALRLRVLSRIVEIRWSAEISAPLRRRIATYGASMTVTLTLGLIVWQRSEVFILGLFRDSSEVAYYSIAYAMSDALQAILPVALTTAIFPSISRALAGRDSEFARRAYENSLRLTTMAVLPVAVAGAVLSAPAIDVLYGNEFDDAAVPFAILLFSAGAQRVGHSSTLIVLGSDRERLIMWFTAAWAVVNIGLGLWLIPPLGVTGATAANAATQFSAVVVGHLIVRRTAGFGLPAAALLRIVAANLPVLVATALVVRVVDNDLATLGAGVAVVPLAYAFGLWITGAVGPLERQYLNERLGPLLPFSRR